MNRNRNAIKWMNVSPRPSIHPFKLLWDQLKTKWDSRFHLIRKMWRDVINFRRIKSKGRVRSFWDYCQGLKLLGANKNYVSEKWEDMTQRCFIPSESQWSGTKSSRIPAHCFLASGDSWIGSSPFKRPVLNTFPCSYCGLGELTNKGQSQRSTRKENCSIK